MNPPRDRRNSSSLRCLAQGTLGEFCARAALRVAARSSVPRPRGCVDRHIADGDVAWRPLSRELGRKKARREPFLRPRDRVSVFLPSRLTIPITAALLFPHDINVPAVNFLTTLVGFQLVPLVLGAAIGPRLSEKSAGTSIRILHLVFLGSDVGFGCRSRSETDRFGYVGVRLWSISHHRGDRTVCFWQWDGCRRPGSRLPPNPFASAR